MTKDMTTATTLTGKRSIWKGLQHPPHPNVQQDPRLHVLDILNKCDVYDAEDLEPIFIEKNYSTIASIFNVDVQNITKNIDRFDFELIKLTNLPDDTMELRYRRAFYVVPHNKIPPEPLNNSFQHFETWFNIKLNKDQRKLLKAIRDSRRTAYNEAKRRIVITSKIRQKTFYSVDDCVNHLHRLRYLKLIQALNRQGVVGRWKITSLGREYLEDPHINLKYD